MSQPEPPGVNIPSIGDKLMYSMMPATDLMKLRKFLDALIKWKVNGNPVHIMTIEYAVTESEE